MTLGGKDNDLEPGNHCVYRRTDRWTDNPIPVYLPPNFIAGGIKIINHHGTNNCKDDLFNIPEDKPLCSRQQKQRKDSIQQVILMIRLTDLPVLKNRCPRKFRNSPTIPSTNALIFQNIPVKESQKGIITDKEL
jgi:hypothetical protein